VPNRSVQKSALGPQSATDVSVYDFLYVDVSRVNSFLAQFDPHGLIQTIKETRSAGSTAENVVNESYGTDVKVVRAITDDAHKTSLSEAESGEWAYDPFWQNALSLLEYLDRHQFLQRRLTEARIGQIVLVKGQLSVFDLPWVKEIFSDTKALSDFQRVWLKGQSLTEKQRAVLHMLKLMPFPIQALMTSENGQIWSVLNATSLQISAPNLFLKYGTSLSGEWAILGTLDAMPEEPKAEETKAETTKPSQTYLKF